MATTLFDCPLFVQRKYHIEEITSLEEAFDLLETWPTDQRGLSHEVLMKACHDAANGCFPLSAVRANLERFLRKVGMLADIKDMPDLGGVANARNLGSS